MVDAGCTAPPARADWSPASRGDRFSEELLPGMADVPVPLPETPPREPAVVRDTPSRMDYGDVSACRSCRAASPSV
jgi:hypothetical protein